MSPTRRRKPSRELRKAVEQVRAARLASVVGLTPEQVEKVCAGNLVVGDDAIEKVARLAELLDVAKAWVR